MKDIDQLSEHFHRSEFECQCGCGYNTVDAMLMAILNHIRLYLDAPITITSGCRCEAHNKTIGGSPNSQHVQAKAIDFKVKGYNEDKVADLLEEWYPDCFGIGRYNGRTHLDVRPLKARWDMRS